MTDARHTLRGSPRRIEAWIFADVTSRLALVGASYDDVGKVGYQEDDNTYWRLSDYDPVTWLALGSGTPPAITGDKYYRHVQSAASATWTIVHNLDKIPSIAIVDSVGRNVYGDVTYPDGNTIVVTFSAAIGGEAYLN